MSFLGNPPAPTAADEPTIENDGWFPDIDLAKLRATARLDGTVTPDRLRYSALTAIASMNRELARYKAAQLALGFLKLDDVPGESVGGTRVQVIHYLRAVYSYVQADLIERYRDFDATGAGDTFDGSFLARLLAGDDLKAAARYANVAAALSTKGYGAVTPIPRAAEVQAEMARAGSVE